jgi:hypothetical protein
MKSVSRSGPNLFLFILLVLALTPIGALAQVTSAPPLLSFQGRLAKPDGTPVPDGTYSIKFTLFTAATGGTQKWTETLNPVQVHGGAFAVLLGKTAALTDAVFAGSLWLEVKIGSDPALTPRQQLVSVAYAMKADTVPDGSIGAAQLRDGAVTASKLASSVLNTTAWLLSGNSGTTGSSFLGTTDLQPLTLKANNRRVLQYTPIEDTSDPDADLHHRTVNVLGGADINTIAPGVMGATIVGGGDDYFTGFDNPNSVTDNFGTVVGGSLNSANGFSFIGGGYNNNATQFYSTIVGGTFNTASNNQTFIGGGIGNTASGFGAVVPGGQGNTASGTVSFAAGNGAQALHDGSFVWADNSAPGTTVNTTGSNQFVVRAAGGVYLQGFTNVQNIMAVDAGLTVDNTDISAGAVSNGLRFGHFSGEGLTSKRTAGGNQFGLDFLTAFFPRMSITNNGLVGINTTAPQTILHIYGDGGIFNMEGADHCYLQFYPRGFATGRKGYFGFPGPGSHDIEIANEDGGAVRVIGNFVNASDARWKTNVSTLGNALSAVMRLRGVTYDWRQDIAGKHFPEGRQVGFLAQEVEEVLPEVVSTDGNGYKSVAYVNVVPVLVEAIKQQQTQIQAQQKQIEDLNAVRAENAAMKARLDALDAAVRRLMAQSR